MEKDGEVGTPAPTPDTNYREQGNISSISRSVDDEHIPKPERQDKF